MKHYYPPVTSCRIVGAACPLAASSNQFHSPGAGSTDPQIEVYAEEDIIF